MALDPVGYYANVVLTITYGVYLVLSLACLHYQSKKWRTSNAGTLLLAFNVVMLLVNTIFLITMLIWMQYALGGDVESVRLLGIVKDSMNVLNIWMSNGLLIYRLWVLYSSQQRPALVMAGPMILMLGVLVTGILLLVQDNEAGTIGSRNRYGVAFWCLSLILNVVVSCTIATKLLPFLQHSQYYTETAVQASQYMSIISGLIESAALYTVTGFIFVGLVVAGSPYQSIFGVLFNAAAAITPNLILLRMAIGTAFNPAQTYASTMTTSTMSRSVSLSSTSKTMESRYSFHKDPGMGV